MFHFHKWIEIKNTGSYSYKECIKCKKRKIKQIRYGGYQPVNWEWLKKQ